MTTIKASILPIEDPIPTTMEGVVPLDSLVDTNRPETTTANGKSSRVSYLEDSDGDDTSSEISETSTIEYSQEPFSTFQEKVTKLIIGLFPGHTKNDIAVERMKGGGFNRIVGVAVSQPISKLPQYAMSNIRIALATCVLGKPQRNSKAKKYILRIPRDEVHDLHYQYITLTYLARKLPYPVPHPIITDSGTTNALGCAYILQNRLPGQALSFLWPSLTLEQRKSAVHCIATLTRDLRTIKHQCPGVISIRNTTRDLDIDLIKIEPVPMPNSTRPTPFTATLAPHQTTRDFLLDLCARQRAHAAVLDVSAFNYIWTGFERIIRKLHNLDLISDSDAFYLFHPDLQARNLLFTLPSPTCVRLTGVLDWDAAVFAPKFVSARAPFFLWVDEGSDEEAEAGCLVEPEDTERRAYKRCWEVEVGEERVRDAYRMEYVVARRMWYVLVRGIKTGGDMGLAEEVLEAWEEMYPE
jgi:aminoglycoside phosphotransferase (APT) family kinase protein